ncbi:MULTISPECIES: DUF2062 domain-containing protein [unclassified Halomonas]|uniref:DUF2062 domain-containing protein n=1 Tax=unclassified Halomonas TaxID=2609666 RepID=UPI0021E38CE3|nr:MULTISPECIES: DUF2062 domain-containing protein [unclassified Halomonas]UYF98509.1 DUF2062 domain-containing protein [Halomonas sp. GD1P12]WNL40377.1 DUF2062 domain-containing protein [Halomonas sp. PAMB 3232]WNL43709.1 DUF2062 domain-containing protein [Halomonas sp. PAMB 3264]
MPRRFLQRYMPKPDTLRRQRSLRFMAPLIADPGLWLLTRKSVANAFSVGIFCALLPIPLQMMVAALGARIVRCNLALSVSLVWITNPLTMPVIFYFNYRVGTFLMGAPVREAPSRISTRWLAEQMHDLLPPLFLGSIVTAVVLAVLANVAIRLLWRWHVSYNWKRRRQKRRRRRAKIESEFDK